MGENISIEWCHHTFNPFIGCTKVSGACRNCYAETLMDKRLGKVKWGKGQPRVKTSPANWAKPLTWNDKAAAAEERHRVFCASLADVFDDEVDPEWREELFRLIRDTPNLDWLLLTKRPQNMREMLPAAWQDGAPPNVWHGVTVEDQAAAEERIPILLQTPAVKRFLSVEPLLGPVMLQTPRWGPDGWVWRAGMPCTRMGDKIDWVICGGESGPGARPMHPDWARALRDQCVEAGVPFLFKQWGAHRPVTMKRGPLVSGGGFTVFDDGARMFWVGKKAAGRTLDGRTWDEVPT